MKIYEIYYSELETYVKFKVLSAASVDDFMQTCTDMDKRTFMRYVVDNFVFNLKTDILASLRNMDEVQALNTLQALYYGCVMLNPQLDVDDWIRISSRSIEAPVPMVIPDDFSVFEPKTEEKEEKPKAEIKKISKNKFLTLKTALKSSIIGQDHAIETIVEAMKRSQAGLEDKNMPLGVFLCCGSSGVGKTSLAKELQKHLYGKNSDIVRIDCGEYQQKHDSQRLIGSASGYVGYEDGGYLTNKLIANPNTVVLLDEVEKAHPNVWNMFLNVFDEGHLTDNKGNKADFSNSIIIMTTNLGNRRILDLLDGQSVGFGNRGKSEVPYDRLEDIVSEEIKKYFRPELVNRIDKVIVFNHLSSDDLKKIAELEMEKVAAKLSPKGIRFSWDESIIDYMVSNAESNYKGARGMSIIRRECVESKVADAILSEKTLRGSIFDFVHDGENFCVNVTKPKRVIKKMTDEE